MSLLVKYLLCVAGGVGFGYYIAQYHLREQFEEDLQRQVRESSENAKEFYRLKYEKKLKVDAGTNQGVEWPSDDPEFMKDAISAAETIGEYLGVDVDAAKLASNMAKVVEENQDAFGESGIDVMSPSKHILETATPVFEGEPVGLAKRFEKPAIPRVDYGAISQAKRIVTESDPSVVEGVSHAVQTLINDSSMKEQTAEARSTPDLQEKVENIHPAVEISKDDYIQNKSGLEQYSFTYFVGDDVLTNESDEPLNKSLRNRIVSQEMIQKLKVGPEAMDGENTLYIRNPDFNEGAGVEVEIERSAGKFSVEVQNQTG